MLNSQLLAFTLVVLVLAITPGADTMLVIKNAVRSGSTAGWATSLGVLTGTLVHAVISALGLSAILAQSAAVFELVKWLGALCLIWIGVQAICTAGRTPMITDGGARQAAREAFREGLVTNVLNAKVAIFYLAFLPQFIAVGDPVLAKSVLLATIHNVLSLIWLGSVVLVIARGKRWFQQKAFAAWLSQISGVILVGLGLRLALENR